VTMVVQVNGKLRSRVEVGVDSDEETVKSAALGDSRVRKYTEGKEIVKVVVVKNKLVSIAVR